MDILIQVAFTVVLFYLVALIYFISKARTEYDMEKRKSGKKINRGHPSEKASSGSLMPQSIIDFDPAMEKFVNKHNQLVRIYQVSCIIGIPLLLYLGWLMTKM